MGLLAFFGTELREKRDVILTEFSSKRNSFAVISGKPVTFNEVSDKALLLLLVKGPSIAGGAPHNDTMDETVILIGKILLNLDQSLVPNPRRNIVENDRKVKGSLVQICL